MMRILLALLLQALSIVCFAQVKTGIDMLKENDFRPLKGKRVGLITNPTGVDRNLQSTIDILFEADSVELVSLFAPEHGVRGDALGGENISQTTDARTGVKVYSLYGKTYKPTVAMLHDIDVLIYDIQDIGCRSYTFISTMGSAMEACAECGVKFIVLDRPNPLGGEKVEGPLVEKNFQSFVGKYPIPYIYGLTVGELAMMLNDQGMLRNGIKADLEVVKMQGWKRDMLWDSTGLPWVLTSPHIPQPITAIYYPVSGILGELNTISIGVGYTLPFQIFCASWIDAIELCDKMNSYALPGWEFRPIYAKPYYGLGQGKSMQGVQPYITDYKKANLTLVQFYIVEAIEQLYPLNNPIRNAKESRLNMFDKVCGSSKIRTTFMNSNCKVSSIEKMWNEPAEQFSERRKQYFLY